MPLTHVTCDMRHMWKNGNCESRRDCRQQVQLGSRSLPLLLLVLPVNTTSTQRQPMEDKHTSLHSPDHSICPDSKDVNETVMQQTFWPKKVSKRSFGDSCQEESCFSKILKTFGKCHFSVSKYFDFTFQTLKKLRILSPSLFIQESQWDHQC